MKIGIKYCGGCNPSFDRKQFVNLLQREFNDTTFENADRNTCYDLLLVICGCVRACANSMDYKCRKMLHITKETDFSRVKGTIRTLQ